MKVLIVSDIHANFPALAAVDRQVNAGTFDMIINSGDSLVYATFPNETLNWLREKGALSILGNTDIKVLKLLAGKTFKKPGDAEKRIMYTWTAEHLAAENRKYLAGIGHRIILDLEGYRVGVFHGSPENETEHLFRDTPNSRFQELTRKTDCRIIITGHSHSPYHKRVNNVHFINPGSVGRMFDNNPEASYAILELENNRIQVSHYRCPYDIDLVAAGLEDNVLPAIYAEMFRLGKKLN